MIGLLNLETGTKDSLRQDPITCGAEDNSTPRHPSSSNVQIISRTAG